MATFGTLQTRVQENIIDLPTRVQNRVPVLINQAFRKLQERHNFKVMEAVSDVLVTTKHERTLTAVFSDFKEFRGRPFMISELGITRELGIAPDVVSARRIFGATAGGEASAEALEGPPRLVAIGEPKDDLGSADFLLYPLPDGRSQYTDKEYRIAIPYWRYLPPMSSGGAQNWFTEYADLWLEYQATANGFFMDWDEDRGTMWTQRATIELRDVLNADKKFRLSFTENVGISLDVHGPRAQKGDVGSLR